MYEFTLHTLRFLCFEEITVDEVLCIALYYISGTSSITAGLDGAAVNTNVYNVTFNASFDSGVDRAYIVGSFSSWNIQEQYALEKQDENGLSWSIIVPLVAGDYEYKVVSYATNEATEADWEGGDDRAFTVSGVSTINARYGYRNVTFKVDLNGASLDSTNGGIKVAGLNGSWDAISGFTLNEGLYTKTIEVTVGTQSFKFLNGNTWEVSGEGNHRRYTVSADGIVTFKLGYRTISVNVGEWDTVADEEVFYAYAWSTSNGVSAEWYALYSNNTKVDIKMGCDSIILVRMDASKTDKIPGWDAKWNQSEDMSVLYTENTLVFKNWSGGTDGKSHFEWE